MVALAIFLLHLDPKPLLSENGKWKLEAGYCQKKKRIYKYLHNVDPLGTSKATEKIMGKVKRIF